MAAHVSIVIPSRNEGELLPATVASIARARTDLSREVIVVDDGSAPSVWRQPRALPGLPLSLIRTAGEGAAAARNRGAARATGDWLCFCDAHVMVPDGWLDGLVNALRSTGADAAAPGLARDDGHEARGFGYTWTAHAQLHWLPKPEVPEPVPFLPGGCLLVTRRAFEAAGGFDGGLVPWGHEDTEISLALWLTGHDCIVAPDVLVAHHFRPRHPYFVRRDEVDDNLMRVAWVHFAPARAQRFGQVLGLGHRLPAVAANPTAQRRRARLLAARRRSDDWFCEMFGLDFWD
ncbi:MAG TPA: glycosyltransferase [Bacillota bacterium]|nr:glycosyltransferase [Bacillota bacterium]